MSADLNIPNNDDASHLSSAAFKLEAPGLPSVFKDVLFGPAILSQMISVKFFLVVTQI